MSDKVRVILVIEGANGVRRYVGPYRSIHSAERAAASQAEFGERWHVEPLQTVDSFPAPAHWDAARSLHREG